MTQITPAMIATAERAGACPKALAWLRSAPRTLDDLARERPMWYVWCLDACPGLIPGTAIMPAHVDAIVAADPWAAAKYLSASLTPAQVDAIVADDLGAAAKYLSASLTPAQVDAIVARGYVVCPTTTTTTTT